MKSKHRPAGEAERAPPSASGGQRATGLRPWASRSGRNAARHLGVSARTLRRWIKAEKLEARLVPGPYETQYLVPRSMAGVEVVHEVGRAEREAEREAIPRVLEGYLAERESAVAAEMAALRAEMREAMGRLEALLAEIRTLRGELSARGDCAERPDVPGPPADAGQP